MDGLIGGQVDWLIIIGRLLQLRISPDWCVHGLMADVTHAAQTWSCVQQKFKAALWEFLFLFLCSTFLYQNCCHEHLSLGPFHTTYWLYVGTLCLISRLFHTAWRVHAWLLRFQFPPSQFILAAQIFQSQCTKYKWINCWSNRTIVSFLFEMTLNLY